MGTSGVSGWNFGRPLQHPFKAACLYAVASRDQRFTVEVETRIDTCRDLRWEEVISGASLADVLEQEFRA